MVMLDGKVESPTITILQVQYDKLLEQEKLLTALFEMGVDKWEGYEAALKNIGYK